ncbi:MAG: UDP-N-acetylglucosamine 1-carboxyvinyltransferase [Deltaproteobacteria bacterium CG11_big_fil_rev_8_21_14_0_20_45_16]|nr:MAG: UDP-N-acetylglucosamine 1-carboxyvinyltransferase [Deltaproteobacteria bacterium CG11_big_fil_rev_8_21_14_0_20_45_16]
MDSLFIEGGRQLKGEVLVPSSKNASLPLMCLSLLTAEPVHIENLPDVSDIESLKLLLRSLGVKESEPGHLHCAEIHSTLAPYDLVRKMRASIMVLGPLLARAGHAEVSLPGGCAIGERPIDIHLKGLAALGAEIKLEAGYVHARAGRLRGAKIDLGFPTVTGTLNIVMAASLAEGETHLENCAREPEVVECIQVLRKMGADIEGEGTSNIRIRGKTSLSGVKWKVQSDRIQFLTYMAAGAITKGEVTCYPYRDGSLDLVFEKFREMGCEIEQTGDRIRLKSDMAFKPVEIETAPFPGFPTDGQAQFMACLSLGSRDVGRSHIRENVFENRFQHVSELRRMGANIRLRNNLASIQAVEYLSGASVMASDLRASASLVLAGLVARGKTEVLRVYHLDRGYEAMESKLKALGAKVWRAEQ